MDGWGGVPDLLDDVDVGGYDGNDEDVVERQLVVGVAPHVVAGEAKVYIWDPFPPIFIQFPFDLPRGNISLAVTLISNHHEGEF